MSVQLALWFRRPLQTEKSRTWLEATRRFAEAVQRERAKRLAARAAAKRAVKAGRLMRQPCEVCGYLDVEGHHDDYDQPLQVRWLCAEHHRAAHRTIDNPLGRAARAALA